MITAHSPKYNADGTIDLIAKFPWLDFEVPFTVNPADIEHHSVDLFNRAVAGEFGTIAPYIPPVLTPERVAVEVQRAQDKLDLEEVRTMPFVNYLVTHKPIQIANRISNDIATDGMEAVLIKLAKVVAVLAKNNLR